MAAPKAPLFDSAGKKAKDLTLEETVFGAELKPHVVHETVRAEMNADRRGTRAAKSRGLSPAAVRSLGGKGNRPRPSGHDPGSAVDRRRRRVSADPRDLT
jgi:ribosomal protein L4